MSSAEFDRYKVINILIEDDFNDIVNYGGYNYLRDILNGGHIGYDNMLDEELIKECEERDISYLVGDNDDVETIEE